MATLKDIIDEIYYESLKPDSMLRQADRTLMIKYAKAGMRELGATIGEYLYAYNFTIGQTCRIEKPESFESFVRAYLNSCDGKIIEIGNNSSLPKAVFTFLHDCDGSILGDECSGELLTNCVQCNDDPACQKCIVKCGCQDDCGFIADIVKYKDSWIREDGNYFVFSDDLEGKSMIVEYISNNLNKSGECDIYVPAEIEEALNYYIKFKILEFGQDTHSIAMQTRQTYKNLKKVISNSKFSLTMNDIYQFTAQKSSFI